MARTRRVFLTAELLSADPTAELAIDCIEQQPAIGRQWLRNDKEVGVLAKLGRGWVAIDFIPEKLIRAIGPYEVP